MTQQVLVGILSGSDSDLNIMQEAAKILDELEVGYEMLILSAHKTPEATSHYAQSAQEKGIKVIICGAGLAAHLAGVVASQTLLPVIGIPIPAKDTALGGMDALLSTVQMPGGVPVATMGIGSAGAKNAGLLAAQILSLLYPDLQYKLKEYRQNQAKLLEEKSKKLLEIGCKEYLAR